MPAVAVVANPSPWLPTRAFPSSPCAAPWPRLLLSPPHPPRLRSMLRPLPCAAASSTSSPSSSVSVPDPDMEPPEPAHDDEAAAAESSRPRRIALFVEPSPFAYVSGYKNRFQNFIKYLREMGDEVIVVTTHEGVPQEFHGAKLIGSWRSVPLNTLLASCSLPAAASITNNTLLACSFPCPWYQKVPLSLALSPRIIGEVARFKPDIIHASSPGIMVISFYRIHH